MKKRFANDVSFQKALLRVWRRFLTVVLVVIQEWRYVYLNRSCLCKTAIPGQYLHTMDHLI